MFLEGAGSDGKPLAPSVSAVGPTGRRYALAVSASDAAKGELVADVPGDLLAPGASYGLEVRGWRGSVSKPRAWRSYLERLVRITAGAAPDTHAGAVVSGDAFEVGMEVQAVGEPWGGGAVVGDIKWTDVIVPSGDGINYKTLDVAIGELAEGILMKGDTERTRMRDDIQGTMELLFYHGRSITNFVNFIGPAIFDLLNPIAAKLGGSALMGYADVDMNAGGFVHVQQIKFPKVDIPGASITSLPAMCLLTESEYAGLAEKDPGVLYVVKG